MMACFFGKTGQVATVQVDDRRTVNASWYLNHCIPQAIDAWQNELPRGELRWLPRHHDNTGIQTMDLFLLNSIQLVTHPPYPLDLAPCDFLLFLAMKEKFRGTKSGTPCASVHVFGSAVSDVSDEQWASCLNPFRPSVPIDSEAVWLENEIHSNNWLAETQVMQKRC